MLILLGEITWKKNTLDESRNLMLSILNPAKMFVFSAQAGYDKDMISKLGALCKFNALFHIKNWLTWSVRAHTLYNDLNLWHELNKYCRHDPLVSNAAMKAMERHFWYLTKECTVFSLSSDFPLQKAAIAWTLLWIPPCKDFESERDHPTFPVLNHSTKLSSLIGPKSWFLFHSLEIGTDWIRKSVSEWDSDSNYKEAETYVRHVKVVNDLSERAVKLIQNFSTSITNDEKQKQFLLQVVNCHHKQIPNF